MKITCKCGHTAPFNDFCRSPVYGDLPAGQYQCPGCGFAWQRKESEHRLIWAGDESLVIPGKMEILTIESRL
jgi:hypothetical protein